MTRWGLAVLVLWALACETARMRPPGIVVVSEDGFRAHPCCQDGEVSLCLGPEIRWENPDLYRCAIIHEREHVDQIRGLQPGVCVGQPDGTLIYVRFDAAEEYHALECRAIAVERNCLLVAGEYNQATWVMSTAKNKYGCD